MQRVSLLIQTLILSEEGRNKIEARSEIDGIIRVKIDRGY